MKEAFYFSHDANAQHDPKIIKMLSQLGWEGYGLYWALVERLRNEPTYILQCDYDCIAFALRSDSDIIKRLVLDYDLFEVEDGYFWSESLLNRMKMKEERSKKARENALKRWKGNAKAVRKHSKPNAIKEKKVKEKKINIPFEKFWSMYDKKVGDKNKIKAKWFNLTNLERNKVMETLPTFLKTISDKQYQPYPMTYLNNKRWEDDLTIHKTSEEKLLESQENQIKRERQKQRMEWDRVEKESANAEEVSMLIKNWKDHKSV